MSAPGPSWLLRCVSPGKHVFRCYQFAAASAETDSLTVSPPSLMLTTE